MQELFSHYGNEDGGPGESNTLFLGLPKDTQVGITPAFCFVVQPAFTCVHEQQVVLQAVLMLPTSDCNTIGSWLQALVRPYLDSKFSLLSTPVPPGVIFGTARGNTFQKWMYNWPRQLTIYHATGTTHCMSPIPLFKHGN